MGIPFKHLFFRLFLFHLCITSLFFSPANNLTGQTLLTRTYNISDGLASPTINGIAQDHMGRMWFATLQGITCYDGTEWKNYSMKNFLPSPRYYHIVTDPGGNVFACSWELSEGITLFNGKTWEWIDIDTKRLNIDPGERIRITSTAVVSPNGRTFIAVGTIKYGLLIYDLEEKKWFHTGSGSTQTRTDIFRVSSDHYQHRFYMASATGVYFVEPGKSNRWVAVPIETPSLPVYFISVQQQANRVSPDGTPAPPRLWLTGKTWIGALDRNNFTILYRGPIPGRGKPGEFLQIIALPDGFGGLWLGDKNSLINISGRGIKKKFRFHSSLHTEGTYSLFYDCEFNLWVGSPNGLSKITSLCFENYNMTSGLYDGEVTAIMELGVDQLIFGHNGGFTFQKDDSFVTREIRGVDRNILTGARVLDMCRDRVGNVWAAVSRKGFARITPSREIRWFSPVSDSRRDTYSSVVMDSYGTIWGSAGKKLFELTARTITEIKMQGETPSIRRLFSFHHRKKYLYLAGHSNLYSADIEKKEIKSIATFPYSVNDSIYAVGIDKQDRIYAGGLGGLFIIEKDQAVPYNPGGFKIKVPVFFILEDPDRVLWFGLDNGVVRWDGRNVRHYTMEEGLLGTETNRAAGYIDKEGRLWIGTELGAARYYKERDPVRLVPPQLNLVSIGTQEKSYPPDKRLELSHALDDLTFNFRGISFIDERKITYKFKLEGFDKQWQSNSRPSLSDIRYTNLSPGSYTFHIQAVNRLGTASKVVSSPIIIIKKPFHQTWFFYLLIAICFIILVALVLNYFSKKRYAVRLEEQVKIRTRQLKSSENEFRNIFNNAHDAILVFEPKAEIILDINQRACDMYGFTRNEMIGMSMEDLSVNIIQGKEKLNATIHSEDFFKFETSQYRKDKSIMQLEINASKITYKGKEAILSINRDITERKFNEEQLEHSLHEKDILLKEIHHRVKNNLQIISSLLDLQSDTQEDPGVLKIFQDSKNRIHSMALIHENLYQSGNLAQIDMQGYINQLIDSFYSIYENQMGKVSFQIEVEEISLNMDGAIPVGLILTELLSNSLKHAFPGNRIGAVSIRLKAEPQGNLTLTAGDDGIGLPENMDITGGSSLGLQLVNILTRQLRGHIEYQGEKGTTFIIQFPHERNNTDIVRFRSPSGKSSTVPSGKNHENI